MVAPRPRRLSGLGCFFDGDLWGIVPILDWYQHLPVPALLEAARRQHAAAP